MSEASIAGSLAIFFFLAPGLGDMCGGLFFQREREREKERQVEHLQLLSVCLLFACDSPGGKGLSLSPSPCVRVGARHWTKAGDR